MDKFGIFNVLSSLLGQSTRQNDGLKADGGNFSTSAAAEKSETQAAEKRATFPPLQSSMLETMRNHDEFVKRVKKQNK